jgi:hypothetical protein
MESWVLNSREYSTDSSDFRNRHEIAKVSVKSGQSRLVLTGFVFFFLLPEQHLESLRLVSLA